VIAACLLYLTVLATVANAERRFSKLMLIKTYFQSSVNSVIDASNRLATIHQSQTGQTDSTDRQSDNLIAYGELFYKRSPKN